MRPVEKPLYIICPKCGAEYLPCEIYYPNQFLGYSKSIDKLEGKIESFSGNNMNLEESFICDHCDTKFTVTSKVSFKTQIIDKYDVSKAYATPLFEDKLTLSEDF